MCGVSLREKLELYEKLDSIQGIKAKRKYMKEHDPSTGKDAKHGTYYVNYTGQMDWGEVADYIESYVLIVEGHIMLEVTSVGEKIFVCFMQILNNDKYINAFREVILSSRVFLSLHQVKRQVSFPDSVA